MKVGDIVKGKVVNIKNYGVFVELENGTLALCHISEISKNTSITFSNYLI